MQIPHHIMQRMHMLGQRHGSPAFRSARVLLAGLFHRVDTDLNTAVLLSDPMISPWPLYMHP